MESQPVAGALSAAAPSWRLWQLGARGLCQSLFQMWPRPPAHWAPPGALSQQAPVRTKVPGEGAGGPATLMGNKAGRLDVRL